MRPNVETLIVAVSGGIDSAALLHMLHASGTHELIVAHFDHGIRPDSLEDRLFTQGLANTYGLPFTYAEGSLGAGASEAAARQARYAFLHETRARAGADKIAMAHQADDVIETAILNLRRGTGRRGLSALRSSDMLYRPLLHMRKREIYDYALKHGLEWREDMTNAQDAYARNRVRHHVVPKLDQVRFLEHLRTVAALNDRIDFQLERLLDLHVDASIMPRAWFTGLPIEVGREILASWLRRFGLGSFDSLTLLRLDHAARELEPGKQVDIYGGYSLKVSKDILTITPDIPMQTGMGRVY